MHWLTSANPPTHWLCSTAACITVVAAAHALLADRGARAEMHAHLGDRDAARRGFDNAEHLLPADSDDPTMPYLSLSITHLVRWRGHGLALLGEAEAIDYLTPSPR